MNLLRNAANELPKGARLLKSLKRAEEYLFSAQELNGVPSNSNNQPKDPTSIPSFKSLFQEEAKLLPSYLSKLNVASHHPVMDIARDFYSQNPSMPSLSPALQLRAIFVLLITKSIALTRVKPGEPTAEEVAHSQLVESKQKALSQITELMFAGHVLHRAVVNISDRKSNVGLHEGNKLATLMGDLLMAKTSRRLSDLKNHTVTEIMSNTICEFSESGFIGEGVTPMPMPQPQENGTGSRNSRMMSQTVVNIRPFLSYQNWAERSRQNIGSIVGNSCISCMVLSGQVDEGIQRFASDFGRCAGILLQAYRDITTFEADDGTKQEAPSFIDLWALPVIFEAEKDIGLISDSICLDHEKIFRRVQSSKQAIENSRHVLANFQKQSINFLEQLKPSEPVSIMSDIITSMNSKTT